MINLKNVLTPKVSIPIAGVLVLLVVCTLVAIFYIRYHLLLALEGLDGFSKKAD